VYNVETSHRTSLKITLEFHSWQMVNYVGSGRQSIYAHKWKVFEKI